LDAEGEDTSISCKANVLVLFNPVLRFGPQIAERINNDQVLAKAISPTEHLEKDSPPTSGMLSHRRSNSSTER
jgi:hypothetical protein